MIQQLIRWTILGAGGALLASCATYPYDTAFNSCEAEANQCYRLCEDIPDENGYIACQRHCDADIDRCFNSAYNSYNSTYYGYGYGSPSIWYGRYGAWYPDYGYYLSFNFYDRYGYRRNRGYPWGAGRYNYSPRRYDGNRNDYRDHDRRRSDGDRRYNYQGAPTSPRSGDYRSRPQSPSGSPTYNRSPRTGSGNRGPRVLPPQSAPRTPPPPRATNPAQRSAPPPPPRRSAPPPSTSDDNSSSRSRGDGPRRRNRD